MQVSGACGDSLGPVPSHSLCLQGRERWTEQHPPGCWTPLAGTLPQHMGGQQGLWVTLLCCTWGCKEGDAPGVWGLVMADAHLCHSSKARGTSTPRMLLEPGDPQGSPSWPLHTGRCRAPSDWDLRLRFTPKQSSYALNDVVQLRCAGEYVPSVAQIRCISSGTQTLWNGTATCKGKHSPPSP